MDGLHFTASPSRLLCPGKRKDLAADSLCLLQGRLDLPHFPTHFSRVASHPDGGMGFYVFACLRGGNELHPFGKLPPRQSLYK